MVPGGLATAEGKDGANGAGVWRSVRMARMARIG
jgi:hypothetical protein